MLWDVVVHDLLVRRRTVQIVGQPPERDRAPLLVDASVGANPHCTYTRAFCRLTAWLDAGGDVPSVRGFIPARGGRPTGSTSGGTPRSVHPRTRGDVARTAPQRGWCARSHMTGRNPQRARRRSPTSHHSRARSRTASTDVRREYRRPSRDARKDRERNAKTSHPLDSNVGGTAGTQQHEAR